MRRSSLIASATITAIICYENVPNSARAAASCGSVAGLVGDGVTDNSTVIQPAIDACNAAGGGTLSIAGAGTYLTTPIQLKSNVLLNIGAGVTLLGTTDHSKYNPAYINWPWHANEALISANGASNTGITGSGTIDGQGGIKDTTNGLSSYWLLAQNYNSIPGNLTTANANGVQFYTASGYTYIPSSNGMPRPWLVEFYDCTNVVVSGVTLKNSPMWHTVIRSSKNVTISGITVSAPVSNPGNIPNADGWASAKNSDAIDIIGSQNVTLTNSNLSVNDDNIALKSFFPLDLGRGTDPAAAGLITQNTTNVTATNLNSTTGHGFSIGSEAGFGVDHVLIQNVAMNNTTGSASNFGTGIRLKTGRDRGSQLHHLTFQNIRMANVAQPITVMAYYPGSSMPLTDSGSTGGESTAALLTQAPLTSTTPYVHDVTIANVTATGATTQSVIEGLPESCMLRVNLTNISITQSTPASGFGLANMTGAFSSVSVTGLKADGLTGTTAAFQPYQNVTVTTAGTNGPAGIGAGVDQLTHANYPTKFAGNYPSVACASQNQQLPQ